jgi:hypothetical protein
MEGFEGSGDLAAVSQPAAVGRRAAGNQRCQERQRNPGLRAGVFEESGDHDMESVFGPFPPQKK